MKSPQLINFDKYECYQQAVQSPAFDVKFFQKIYRQHVGRDPQILREDFCGTHAICCEWVQLNNKYIAYGLDLDPEPLIWGYRHNQSDLSQEQKKRLIIAEGNVLVSDIPSTDIVVALNFSYFIFKQRAELITYFKNVRATLKKRGLFILDAFGGTQCQGPITDEKKLKTFTYFWEQKNFDPINHHAQFGIHFKVKDKMYKNVFTYDWRLWSLAELKDILFEAGFSDVHVYWEGTDKQGNGNGQFTLKKSIKESCESWIAYLVAQV